MPICCAVFWVERPQPQSLFQRPLRKVVGVGCIGCICYLGKLSIRVNFGTCCRLGKGDGSGEQETREESLFKRSEEEDKDNTVDYGYDVLAPTPAQIVRDGSPCDKSKTVILSAVAFTVQDSHSTYIDPSCCPNKYTLNIRPLSCAKNISNTLN